MFQMLKYRKSPLASATSAEELAVGMDQAALRSLDKPTH